MPELPEVETIRGDLAAEITGRRFVDVKFLWSGTLKGTSPSQFKQQIIGKEILGVYRRAKNIYISLEGGLNILMHMKMTGHLLLEPAKEKISRDGKWLTPSGALADKNNQYIRAIFWLDNNYIVAFSDLRKFGYIRLMDNKDLKSFLRNYGPEPLTDDFSVAYLTQIFANSKTAIKKILMDQTKISGIGNIYADEILWKSRVNPQTPGGLLKQEEIAAIYKNTRFILSRAIRLRGTSSSDYRDTRGSKGSYEKELQTYRRTGLECTRCHQKIERIKLGGRGTHFCPGCQKEIK